MGGYDSQLRNQRFDVTILREEITDYLIDVIISGQHQWISDPQDGSPEEWMEKFSEDGQDIDNYFAYLCALKLNRKIIIYPLFESEGWSNGCTVIEPPGGPTTGTD